MAMRAAGNSWANPRGFGQIIRPVSQGNTQAADSSANLVWAHGGTYTFKVGNPLSHVATIELRVRRISLPPDWIVNLSRTRLTLDAGKEVDMRANVIAVSPAVPGSRYEVAIEGYLDKDLIGGVLLGVPAPEVVPFALGPPPQVDSGGVVNAASFRPSLGRGKDVG